MALVHEILAEMDSPKLIELANSRLGSLAEFLGDITDVASAARSAVGTEGIHVLSEDNDTNVTILASGLDLVADLQPIFAEINERGISFGEPRPITPRTFTEAEVKDIAESAIRKYRVSRDAVAPGSYPDGSESQIATSHEIIDRAFTEWLEDNDEFPF